MLPPIYDTSPAAILFITVSSRRRICLDPPLVLPSTSIGLKYALNTCSPCLRRPNTILHVYSRGGTEAKGLVDTRGLDTTQVRKDMSVVYSNTMKRLYYIEAIQPLVVPALPMKPVMGVLGGLALHTNQSTG
jgi:hypothetical protein